MGLPQDNKTKSNITIAPLKISSFALSVITILLCLALSSLFLDKTNGYFQSTPLVAVTYALMLLTTASALCLSVLINKGFTLTPGQSKLSVAVSFLPGIAAIPTFIEIFGQGDTKVAVLMSLTALSPIFFNRYSKTPTALRLSAGFLQAIFAILAIARLYFDLTTELNNPVKVFLMLGLASVILATLGELRIALGINSVGYYTATKILSFTFSACGAFPAIFAYIAGVDRFPSYCIALATFIFGYSIYSAYDLLTLFVASSGDNI